MSATRKETYSTTVFKAKSIEDVPRLNICYYYRDLHVLLYHIYFYKCFITIASSSYTSLFEHLNKMV